VRVSFLTVILVAVDPSGGRKDEAATLRMFLHHFEEIERTDHVVLVVHHGLLVTLTNGLLSCEMHNAVDRVADVDVVLKCLL
jgi:hypothetical protein